MEWRPIETAPLDGTVVLLARPKRHYRMVNLVVTGFWRDEKGWCVVGSDQPIRVATHWQPLPEPPPLNRSQ